MFRRLMSPPSRSVSAARRSRSRRPPIVAWTALALCLATLGSGPGHAHGRSLSHSSWTLTETGADVRVRVSLLELSRLGIALPLRGAGSSPETVAGIGRLLAAHVRLMGPSGPCEPTDTPRLHPDAEGTLQYRWSVVCAESGTRTIESDLLLAAAPSHMHFARLMLPGGGVRERVLVEGSSAWAVVGDVDAGGDTETSDVAAGSGFVDYVGLGIEHILTGWDHLAFVFALILLARRVGEVVRLVTGFTLAHSLTLALAVLGFVQPVGHAVEAVIGFSVALVAAENAWLLGGRDRVVPVASVLLIAGVGFAGLLAPAALPWLTLAGLAVFTACHFALLDRSADHSTWRIALAFAFGLVHGFGFAGILAEMSLPTDRLVPALFGFNVGVEVGQLAVVVVVWPLLRGVERLGGARVAQWTPELASAAVCGLGLYWFVLRGLGLG